MTIFWSLGPLFIFWRRAENLLPTCSVRLCSNSLIWRDSKIYTIQWLNLSDETRNKSYIGTFKVSVSAFCSGLRSSMSWRQDLSIQTKRTNLVLTWSSRKQTFGLWVSLNIISTVRRISFTCFNWSFSEFCEWNEPYIFVQEYLKKWILVIKSLKFLILKNVQNIEINEWRNFGWIRLPHQSCFVYENLSEDQENFF